jgi:hypothetical protein
MRVNLREPRSARWLKDISIRLKVGSVRLMHLVVPDKERTRERKIRRNWWKIAKAVIGSGNIAEAPVGQNSSGEKLVDVKAEEQITHTGMVSEVVPEKENNVQKDTSGAGEPHKRLGGAVGRDGPAVNSPEKANECAKEGYTNTVTPKALLTGVTTSKAPEIQYSTVTDLVHMELYIGVYHLYFWTSSAMMLVKWRLCHKITSTEPPSESILSDFRSKTVSL